MITSLSGPPGATDDEVRALEAFARLSLATESLGVELRRSITAMGLTAEELYALGSVLENETFGEHRIEPAVLEALETRGLLCRQSSGDEQRRVEVRATGLGRNLIQTTYAAFGRRLVRSMSVLDRAEQDALVYLCQRLSRSVAAQI